MKSIYLTELPGDELLQQWIAFLDRASFATQYVSPYFFEDPFVLGKRFAILAIDDLTEVRAVLTGVAGPGTITSGLPTRPQMAVESGSCGSEAVAAVLNGLSVVPGAARGLLDIHSWCSLPGAEQLGFQQRNDLPGSEVVMLDLSAGEESIFKDFSQTRRNELRKCQKQGVLEIKQLETAEELRQLHEIHIDWSARKGNAPETLRSFQSAAEQKDCRITFIAKHGSKVVAGSFFRFFHGGVVEYAANNSLPDYQKFRPNDLICWHAIQWACRGGFKHFSMGGAHPFLRRFGGTILRTTRYRKDRTLFRKHENRERLLEFAYAGKRMLPPQIQSRLKPLFRSV